MRYAPAAKQFITDVTSARDAKVGVKPTGEEDGYGVTRSIEFDAATSKWLAPILEAFTDPRIEGVDYDTGKKLVVTFVPDVRADFTEPFPLAAVHSVLNED